MQDQMKLAIDYVNTAPKVKTKGGKLYTQVAQRVEALRMHFPELGLVTDIIKDDGEIVIVKASLLGRIEDGVFTLATGYAEEVRSSKGVNSTSALENCETSAIGRCLAAFGLHGGEYASAGEVEQAVAEQAKPTINSEQHDKLFQLLEDGGLTVPQIEDYRKSLRIARWSDLTVERFERLYAKLEAKLSRKYAEEQAASNDGRTD